MAHFGALTLAMLVTAAHATARPTTSFFAVTEHMAPLGEVIYVLASLLEYDVQYEICLTNDDERCEDGRGGAIVPVWRKCCSQSLRESFRSFGVSSSRMRNPSAMAREFFRMFSGRLEGVDWFYCAMPPVACTLFMAFDKPLVVMSAMWFDYGATSQEYWNEWVLDLQSIAAQPFNTVAATDEYDALHMQYATGIEPVLLKPLYAYQNFARQARPGTEGVEFALYCKHPAMTTLLGSAIGQRFAFVHLHNDRLQYKRTFKQLFDVLAVVSAVVFVPYCKGQSVMYEMYSKAIPLVVPSIALMTSWTLAGHGVVYQLPWPFPGRNSSTRGIWATHPSDEEDVQSWVSLQVPYTLPHLIEFDSVAGLADVLSSTDWTAVVSLMHAHNNERTADTISGWASVLSHVRMHRTPRVNGSSERCDAPSECDERFDEAWRLLYGRVKPRSSAVGLIETFNPCHDSGAPNGGYDVRFPNFEYAQGVQVDWRRWSKPVLVVDFMRVQQSCMSDTKLAAQVRIKGCSWDAGCGLFLKVRGPWTCGEWFRIQYMIPDWNTTTDRKHSDGYSGAHSSEPALIVPLVITRDLIVEQRGETRAMCNITSLMNDHRPADRYVHVTLLLEQLDMGGTGARPKTVACSNQYQATLDTC